MFVNGIGTANPPRSYSKAECWEAFKTSDWFLKLDRRAHIIAETVLTGGTNAVLICRTAIG